MRIELGLAEFLHNTRKQIWPFEVTGAFDHLSTLFCVL
jgi:hypothetical protein